MDQADQVENNCVLRILPERAKAHTHSWGTPTQKPKDTQELLAKAHATITRTRCHSHMWVMVNLRGTYRKCSTKGKNDPLTMVWKKPCTETYAQQTLKDHEGAPRTAQHP